MNLNPVGKLSHVSPNKPCKVCQAIDGRCGTKKSDLYCYNNLVQEPEGYEHMGYHKGHQVYKLKEQLKDTPLPPPLNEAVHSRFVQPDTLTLNQVMQRMDAIYEMDDEAGQLWELSNLAMESRRSIVSLKQMHLARQLGRKDSKPVEVHQVLSKENEDRLWLIAAHISKGTTVLLSADGGTGKSVLAYDLAKAIASGRRWNGFRTRKAKVLIIQTDEPEIDMIDRLRTAGFADLEQGQVFVEQYWQFSQMSRMRKWIQEFGVEFVVIDSMTTCSLTSGSEEKDTSFAKPLTDLRNLASELGCAFFVLHHTNKGGDVRGTTQLRNAVSEVWKLRKGKDNEEVGAQQRVLEIEKSRSDCTSRSIMAYDPLDNSIKHCGELGQDKNAPMPLSARLLNFLEARQGICYDPEELEQVEILGANSREAIRKHLERMRKKGLLDRKEKRKETIRSDGQRGEAKYFVYYAPVLSEEDKTGSDTSSEGGGGGVPKPPLPSQPQSPKDFNFLEQGGFKAGDQVKVSIDHFDQETQKEIVQQDGLPIGEIVTILEFYQEYLFDEWCIFAKTSTQTNQLFPLGLDRLRRVPI